MKLFIILILLLLGTSINFCQEREYYLNLDADNVIDSLIIHSEKEKLSIECNDSIINLGSVSLLPIIQTDSNTVDIIFVDLNNDGNKEIILSTDHPIFANKAILYFFSYKDAIFQKMNIEFGYNDIYDHVIVLDNVVYYNDKNSDVYCKNGSISYENIEGETVFYNKIILIKWDQNIGHLIKAGEKYYFNIKNNEVKEIIF